MVVLRPMWIEVVGLPPSAWSSTNLINIGNLWGKVRGFDERIVKGCSFVCARMLIDTKSMIPIDRNVDMVLGDHHFTLRVRNVPVYPSTPCSLASSVEVAAMANFPASSGDGMPSKFTNRQSREEDEKAPICSKSCATVNNDWG